MTLGRSCSCSVVLCFLVARTILVSAQGIGADELLQQLKSFDRVCSAALTARGQCVESPPEISDIGPTTCAWAVTYGGNRRALVKSLVDRDITYEQPTKDQQAQGGDRNTTDKFADMIKGIPSYTAVFSDALRSAKVEVITVVRIDPSGQLIDEQDSQTIHRYPGDDISSLQGFYPSLWAMGRGFGGLLEKVASISEGDDGMLTVVADGISFSPKHLGRWELQVDPNLQYLVRSAAFYSKHAPEKRSLSISNTKPQLGGAVVFPAEGKYTHHTLFNHSFKYYFNDVELKIDDSVIKEARKRTGSLSSPRTLLLDNTVSPATTTYTGE